MFLIDLLFPKFCLGCGYLGVYLCQSCQNKLEPINTDICFYCKKPSLYGLTHPNCTNKFNINGMAALYRYNTLLKKIIKNIKYRLATEVWEEFSRNIKTETISRIGFYRKLSLDFAIQPIPISKDKFQERGFNQAQMISYFFHKFLNYPIVELLIRKKGVSAQAQITSQKERYLNVKGAFTFTQKSQTAFSSIILVDDVITSGATVEEAARVLKNNGIKNVYVLALAKG